MDILKVIQKANTRRFSASNYTKAFSKGELLVVIGEMGDDDIQEFCEEIVSLVEHKDKVEGLYAINQEPGELLTKFWQRTSDACPLEATESEKQEEEFKDFVEPLFNIIEYKK